MEIKYWCDTCTYWCNDRKRKRCGKYLPRQYIEIATWYDKWADVPMDNIWENKPGVINYAKK